MTDRRDAPGIRVVLVMALVGGAGLLQQIALAADDAVILMYHHVDADTPSSTSTAPDRFADQVQFLASERFAVRPLLEVIEALASGRSLDEKTVVLTFDDAYSSVLENALPLLREYDWPFTVFVTTNYADSGHDGYLDWDELRELTEYGATIGNHTRSHAHLVRRAPEESDQLWRQRIRDEITAASARIASEVGNAAIPVLAYPYGEYDAAVKNIAETLNLFAVGQHSGAAGPSSDLRALPRYPVATGYDALEDFALRVRTRALPARIVGEERHVLHGSESRPTLHLEITPGDFVIDALACYATGQGLMELSRPRDNPYDVLVRPRESLATGRTKYNCTAPSATLNGVYYWYGYLWMKPNDDGSWYDQ